MKITTSVGTKRRLLYGAVGVVASVMILGSTAWACTQRVGTLVVCRPPASTYIASQCGKVTSMTQTGAPTVYATGSSISVRATNFYTKRYAITFRMPGSSASCHFVGPTTVRLPDAATTFLGPTFNAVVTTPPTGTTLGQAKVCAEDVPDVITGQVINLTVI
jgi:hypothetical protein